MSDPIGIVLIMEKSLSISDISRALSSEIKLDEEDRNGLCDVIWALGGNLILRRHHNRFDIIKLLFRHGPLLDDNKGSSDSAMEAIERLMVAAIENLDLSYGYFSVHPYDVTDEWIENEVLVPLMKRDWDRLSADRYISFHLFALPQNILDEVEPTATVLHNSLRGRLFRLDESRNPFDGC